MECSEFLARYSEFHDDEAHVLPDRSGFEAHMDVCSSCRRYRSVHLRGVALLRGDAEPDFREDFRERLQHRLYLEEFHARKPRRLGSSTPLTVGLAAAAILAAVAAWNAISEAVVPTPTLALPPITARTPEAPILRAGRTAPGSQRNISPLEHPDFWGEAHTLLFEYSPLHHRNRPGGVVRTGIQ
jgi:hypothetical protein